MLETCRAFLRNEVEKQIQRVFHAIEPEYKELGIPNILVYPPKKESQDAFIIIRTHKKPNEPPYDNLEGSLFASLKDDFSFTLYADIALTSGGEWSREIADSKIGFKHDIDPTPMIKELLENASNSMIEEFHKLLPEINGNLCEWILERERKD